MDHVRLSFFHAEVDHNMPRQGYGGTGLQVFKCRKAFFVAQSRKVGNLSRNFYKLGCVRGRFSPMVRYTDPTREEQSTLCMAPPHPYTEP